MTGQDNTVQVLLVEDNPVDVLMTKEGLNSWKIKNNLHVVEDGEGALDFLFRRGCYEEMVRPDLVILDLNLPRTSGTEVLAEIKQHSDLSTIAVAVVTSSEAPSDFQKCEELGAKLCITKPLDFEEYIAAIQSLESHCFTP